MPPLDAATQTRKILVRTSNFVVETAVAQSHFSTAEGIAHSKSPSGGKTTG